MFRWKAGSWWGSLSHGEAAGIKRPYVPEAEVQLDGALRTVLERKILAVHEDRVAGAAFSTDGRRIVTASNDGTGRLWEAFPTTQDLVDTDSARVPRCFTPNRPLK